MQTVLWNSKTLDRFFDENTMSLHIKAGRPLLRKKGKPGAWKPIISPDEAMNVDDMKKLIEDILHEVEARDDGFLEIDKALSKIVQLGPYRIVIVYPPLSDGLEMTIVKPIKKLDLEDYDIEPEIIELFRNSSQGILVAGSPGSGKTTFAQALVDLYHQDQHIIKTIESPRDLLVSEDVVQYSFTYGSHDDLRDILLLSRPDYTVYDEVRNKPDFELYKDLRLTGIGLIGVIHATRPVDSIQRFLGTIDMGIIPQVIDTVIFLDKGAIGEILQLSLVVKVPHGMQSEDLARPVILVKSFLSKKNVYEMYSFWEQIVVMPIDDIPQGGFKKPTGIAHYAQDAVKKKLATLLPCPFLSQVKGNRDVDMYVPIACKPGIIGRWGKKIMDLEKLLGLKLHVHTFDELPIASVEIETYTSHRKDEMSIQFPEEYANQNICLLASEELFFFKTNSKSKIIITKAKIVKSLEKKWFLVIDLAHL